MAANAFMKRAVKNRGIEIKQRKKGGKHSKEYLALEDLAGPC